MVENDRDHVMKQVQELYSFDKTYHIY